MLRGRLRPGRGYPAAVSEPPPPVDGGRPTGDGRVRPLHQPADPQCGAGSGATGVASLRLPAGQGSASSEVAVSAAMPSRRATFTDRGGLLQPDGVIPGPLR